MSGDPEFWFKPKSHGYGAYPTHWKGWMVILVKVLFDFLISIYLIVIPAMGAVGPSMVQIVLWVVLLAGSIAVLIHVTRLKTDGEWRWRWRRGR